MATTVQSSWRSIGNKLIISMSLNPITCSCNQHLSHPTQDLDMNKKKTPKKDIKFEEKPSTLSII